MHVGTDHERPIELQQVMEKGNEYLDASFPELSKVLRATVLETWRERRLLVTRRPGAKEEL